jgi:hypothetical protein
MYKKLFLPFVLLCVAGCQSKQTVMFAPSRGRGFATTSERQSSNPAPIGTVGNLRETEAVKVYGINRYVDAADSRIMHERHAIYRLEQQPSWITRSPRNQHEVILGSIVGLRKPEYAPEPMPGEISREIVQARRGIEEANEGMKGLRESQEKLAQSVESLAKGDAEAERKLTTVISVLNERVKRLEGDSANSGGEQPQGNTGEPGDSGVLVRGPNQ